MTRTSKARTAGLTAAALLLTPLAVATTSPPAAASVAAVSAGMSRTVTDPRAAAAEADGLAAARASLATDLSASGIPCGAVAVATTTQIHAAGVGRCGAADVSGTTPFVIGSTSKSFTALAVLQLVDDGKLDLDAPVQRYVPAFTLDDPRAERITVRQLLQQTSGLPALAGGAIVKSATDGTATQALQELRTTRLAGDPGTRWEYANANYLLAGLVVEAASGTDYATLVRRRIFEPLGMRHSYTARSDAVRAGLAEGTQFWFGVPRSTPALTRPALLAAGYLISTAEDLGAYLQLYLRGGRTADGRQIISTRSLQTMLTPASTAQLGSWADGASARYAMGWFIGGPWNPPLAFHPGNSPDTSAMIAVSASTSTAVATLIGASHEMPVPGNPAATDRASRNAIAAALGQPRHPGPSVRSFYIAFDLTCLALILLTGADLTRTGRTRHWRRRRRVGQAISWSGAAARLVLAAGLLALPMLIGYGWNGAWTWAPDLTLATGLIAVLLGASGVRHATVTWRHLKQQPPLTFPQAPADLSR